MTDRATVRLVVIYLGIATILFGFSTAVLVGLVIWLSRGTGSVDAAAVALVGLMAQPAGAALAALGALLVSTRSTPDKAEIDGALAELKDGSGAIPVTGPDGGPVAVTEQPAAAPTPRRGR